MKISLKPISEQRILITGASSGIGLATARMAAAQGASLVLVARSEAALRQLERELRDKGARALAVPADVADEGALRFAADEAVRSFGGLDTWVNNAGISIYGELTDITIDDMRRLFETNFWGVVYGSRIAVELLRQDGGSIITLGSDLSDVAAPLQGIYSASKHAVRGFIEALRVELEREYAPISVTLIKPSAVDTPYLQHARNYLRVEPKHPSPLYAPQAVAEVILCAAEVPTRDISVGGGGKGASASTRQAPRLGDKYVQGSVEGQGAAAHPWQSRDALYVPSEDLRERGQASGLAFEKHAHGAAPASGVSSAAATVMLGVLGTGIYLSRRRGAPKPPRSAADDLSGR